MERLKSMKNKSNEIFISALKKIHFSNEKDLVEKILKKDYSTEIHHQTKDMNEYVTELSQYFKKIIES